MNDMLDQRDPDWVMYIERAKQLSHDEMVIREKVVMEYLYDMSWTRACLRCGFRQEFVEDTANRFMQDPYCIWRVKVLARERGLAINAGDESTREDAKATILAALHKEAHYYGPGSSQSARVSALGKLAQLLGMEPPKQSKVDVAVPGVMIVPAIASVEDWEATAAPAQEKLRDDTLNGVTPVVH
jgi:hypothetical protein